jgi:hypothetical protein
MSLLLGFFVLLLVELIALFYGQRRLFWASAHLTSSRVIAYALAAPGTILHESAHYLAALLLGVPAGDRVLVAGKRGRVSFFFPKTGEDGSVTLGSVPVAATDPLRGALISIAPALLVPPLFAGLTAILLGSAVPGNLLSAFVHAPIWAEAVWLYLAFSCAQAAFPSVGDHIGVLGGAALVGLAGVIVVGLGAEGGVHELTVAARTLALILLVPSLIAGLSLLAVSAFITLRKERRA